jgi:hypothetical protein
MLNGHDAAIATNLAEKCVIGILWGFRGSFPSEFVSAFSGCLSILLPYAAHYSTELVKLLLEHQSQPSLSPEISVNSAIIGPYLEVTILFLNEYSSSLILYRQQFEGHADTPPELKEFIEKYQESKPPSCEIDKPKNFTTKLQVNSTQRRSTR